ncbi:Uncharacterised protein [Sphingobacterium spiritivorum]|uniref:Uncharacterized protein n=1 Tax=Sphingobacterium spiritivorum ATCC 33861 TaxID=525373 RepID=D7VGE8_SPHSI|nr:hypothetical protein HMPREF0766_10067 [Sphingobacterium spiritivorum ATCC 33861]SUJ01533.1 Uncharacterised protein [Sphingobacterium spiritivorum]
MGISKGSIFIYLVIKYLVFFIILAFIDNRFNELVFNKSDNFASLFQNTIGYSLWIVVFSFFLSVIFFIPVFLICKIKNVFVFILLSSLVISLEYFVYVYFTSVEYWYDKNGVINFLVSILFFVFLFFRRHVVK